MKEANVGKLGGEKEVKEIQNNICIGSLPLSKTELAMFHQGNDQRGTVSLRITSTFLVFKGIKSQYPIMYTWYTGLLIIGLLSDY